MSGRLGDQGILDAKYPSQIGAAATLDPAVNVGPAAALSILATSGACIANPQNVTIALDLETPAPTAGILPASTADIIAIVGYGTGGNRHVVECDWRAGTQITVPAAAIQVSAYYQAAPAPTFRAPLRVSLGYGTRPGSSLVTRTTLPVVIAAGAFADFVVPPMAYAFQVGYDSLAPYAVAAGTLAEARAGLAGGAILLQLAGTDLRAAALTEGIRLPGPSRSVRLNNGSALPQTARVMFLLGI